MAFFGAENNFLGGVVVNNSFHSPFPSGPSHGAGNEATNDKKRPNEEVIVIDVDDDDDETGASKTKRSRNTGGVPTTDHTTVDGWEISIGGKKMRSIWGFCDSGNAEKDRRRRNKAIEILKKEGKIHCWWCGKKLDAFKTRITAHVDTKDCTIKRELYLKRHNDAVGSGRGITSVDVQWLEQETFLLCYGRSKSSPSLPVSGEDDPKKRVEYLKSLLVGIAATKGISLRGMDNLFSEKSDFRMGLQRIEGLGSDKKCAQHLQEVIKIIHKDTVLTSFRYAVDNDLPICIASDESPAKGYPVLLAHLFHPAMKEPLCIDVGKMNRACDHSRLIEGLKDLVINNSFLTEAEWKKHVVIFSGDHAAYVIKAAKEAKCEHAGDPAHALDLVVKAIIKACHLKPLCMALRKIFTSKSYVVAALLKAIALKGGTSVLKIPTTRWGYFPKLLFILSQSAELAKIQEAIIWMYHNMYDGSEPIESTSLPWITGVPFKPFSYEVSSLEGEVDDDNDDDGGDWGEERTSFEESEDEEEQDDELDAKEGESLKVIKERKRKTCLQILAVLSNPQVITHISLIVKLTSSLRSCQVTAETAKTARDGALIEKFKAAYKSIKDPLVSESDFKRWAYNDSVAIQAAEPLVPRANIVRRSDGTFTITNMPTTPVYTVSYKKANDAASNAAVAVAMKEILNEVRGPIHAGAKQYEKLVYKCFYVVQRRYFASLAKDLGRSTTDELKELIRLDDAVPPSLRSTRDSTSTTAETSWQDEESVYVSAADKIIDQWAEFMHTVQVPQSICYLTPELRDKPHMFWMNVRKVHPELGNTMLYWLAHPVGTAGLERDFSGLTIECRNFRRSRTEWPTFRASVLSRCYSTIITEKLKEALQ
jgi:hypothetical protein